MTGESEQQIGNFYSLIKYWQLRQHIHPKKKKTSIIED